MTELIASCSGLWRDIRSEFRSLHSPATRRRAGLALLLLFGVVFAFFYFRLEFARQFLDMPAPPGKPFYNDDCILASDPGRYSHGLFQGHYLAFHLARHPLVVMLNAAIAEPLTWLGIRQPVAISISLAFWAAMSSVTIALFLLRQHLSLSVSILATLAVLLTFGTVTTLSVVETYSVSLWAIAMSLLIMAEMARHCAKYPALTSVIAGLAGGVLAGWSHLPAAAFSLVYAGFAWASLNGGVGRKLTFGVAVPSVIAVTCMMAPVVFLGIVLDGDPFMEPTEMVGRYADAANFTNPEIIKDYVAGFFLFSWVAPAETVQCRFLLDRLWEILRDPSRLALTILATILIGWAIVSGTRTPGRAPLVLAVWTLVGTFFVFYLFFNPLEVLLYSSHWTTAIILGSVILLREKPGLVLLLSGIVALSLYVNVSPLADPASFDPAQCCPHGGRN
ncbi:hypothetical protein [Ruegeria arenilitoris]|uniref:hypothetical protein n=1 Tax=Ruegeria arenilitoris TaxID=1173585 RepID=UPI001479E135|nr:hypothetical protein [Ruegeria arenilitoris]